MMRASAVKQSGGGDDRDGIASLELVMSMPIIVFLFAMLYTVYVATIMKAQVSMQVRHEAWLARSDSSWLDQRESLPFGLLQASTAGEYRNELTRDVRVYRNFFPGVPREVEWGNVVLTGSWDHRQVDFSNTAWRPIDPHFGILVQMVTAQGGVNSSSSAVRQLDGLTRPPGLSP